MKLLENYYNKIDALRDLKNNIIEIVEKNDIKSAKELLEDYKAECEFDIDIYYLDAVILIKENRLEEAEERLLQGLGKKSFNYRLNYELAKLYERKKEVRKSLAYYLEAMNCLEDKEKESLLEDIDVLLHTIDVTSLNKSDLEYIKTKVKEINETSVGNKISERRYFPTITTVEGDKYLVGDFLYKKDKEGYYVNYYDSTEFTNIPLELRNEIKTEILYGSLVTEKKKTMVLDEPCVLPISVKEKGTVIKIVIDKEEYILDDTVPHRFYYIPINEKCKLSINSNKEFFLGNRIILKDNNDLKLVLFIFIDGLSQNVLDGNNFSTFMPYTYEFFDKGAKFTNCHINGAWTLTSFANLFTGRYTVKHNFFNLKLNHKDILGDKVPLLSQVFQKHGYLTSQICGNWAKNPNLGYAKGFDRTIYKVSSLSDTRTGEMIMDAIEHISAFNDRSHFMSLSLYELHNVTDNLKLKLPVQFKNTLDSLTDVKEKEKSLRLKYNPKKIEKYKNQILQIDRELKILYDYINQNFNEDEIVVTLVSDHGQSFLSNETMDSHLSRIMVPFMIKGENIPPGYCDDIIENIDIFPTILRSAGIEYNDEIDGKVPRFFGEQEEKDYAYTDYIYAGQRYKAVINDDKHFFLFKTENVVESDGRVDIENSKINLINKETKEVEVDKYSEKVDRYIKIVFDHIKENIKI